VKFKAEGAIRMSGARSIFSAIAMVSHKLNSNPAKAASAVRAYGEISYSSDLPIVQKRKEIIDSIRLNRVSIVSGETGCGKTTQLPLMCLEALGDSPGIVAITQPRRIAALSLAEYVAGLLPKAPSGTVAYKIRFTQTVNADSRIVFMTDGIALAETTVDPLLSRYGVIIIDEAHERTINIDFLLGYLRTILPKRPELRLVIASATIDTGLFSRCFNNAPVIAVRGRLHSVEIRYQPVIGLWKGAAMRSSIDGVIHTVQTILDSDEPGDILVFLPTVDDIHESRLGVEALTKGKTVEVLSLYGRMNVNEQEKMFKRCDCRRVILATNIAETSITVPGIRFVVDTGLARSMRFDPHAGINRMPIDRISKAAADQRAGRSGRVRDGICIRLYSEADYLDRPRFTLPEMRRANLAGALLRMADLGIGNARQFPFLQHPAPAAIAAGYRQLRFLGAFDKKGNLTPLGRRMARLPLDPAVARMLLHANKNGAFHDAAVIASALSVGELWAGQSNFSLFKTPGASKDGLSDFSALVDLWRRIPVTKTGRVSWRRVVGFCDAYGLNTQRVKEWASVHRQLVRICMSFASPQRTPSSYETLHKSLLCAFAADIAHLQDNGLYRTEKMHDITVVAGSRVHGKRSEWVLLHDIVETKRPYARFAAQVKPHWIKELFPLQCRTTFDDPHFEPSSGIVQCLRNVVFNGLPLVKDQPYDLGMARPEQAHSVFIEEALVNEKIGSEYAFILHNRAVLDSIALAKRKLRDSNLNSTTGELARLYDERLPGILSKAGLERKIARERNDRFLWVKETDLCGKPLPDGLKDFPDTLDIAGVSWPLTYVFDPGAPNDGATLAISGNLYETIPLYYWEWLLPVFWRPRIEMIVRDKFGNGDDDAIQKRIDAILTALVPGKGGFLEQVLPLIEKEFGVKPIVPDSGGMKEASLWLRIEIVDNKGIVIDSCRPPWQMPELPIVRHGKRPAQWGQWCAQWEHEGIKEWNGYQALKEAPILPPGQSVPFIGITGFSTEGDHISLCVFLSKAAAYKSHRGAVRVLLEHALNEKIAWAWRDFMRQNIVPYQVRELMDSTGLEDALETLFCAVVLQLDVTLPRDAEGFETKKKKAMDRLASAGLWATEIMKAVLPEYQACRKLLARYSTGLSENANVLSRLKAIEERLLYYGNLLRQPEAPIEKIEQLPRYIKALVSRAAMAMEKPLRYDETLAELRTLETALEAARESDNATLPDNARKLDELDAMVGEYAVLLFAQGKVSPRFSVSAKKLREGIEEGLSAFSAIG
jgi:ATP-dependent helicase HrpA